MLLSDCNDLEYYYYEFQKSTAKSLCKFEKTFYPFSNKILAFVNEISISSVIINLLHFFILTRKPMRTSSINNLMAAVALFDIFTCFQQIEIIFEKYKYIFFSCLPKDTYGLVLARTLLIVVQDYARKCSTWLIIFIAMIRTLLVRNPLSNQFESLGKPKAAAIVIAIVCISSLPVSMFRFLENTLMESIPRQSCAPNRTYYEYVGSELFMDNEGSIAKYFNLLNSLVSDIIPCISLPIVTCLLVYAVLKSNKKRAKLISSYTDKSSRGKTGLVFCVAIMFFIVEFPYGLSIGTAWIFLLAPGVYNILNQLASIFSMLITLNSCTHLIICLIMSSQYRSTTIQIFTCGYFNQKKRISSRSQVP
ncbi:G-protein coupled receptors family 1 profile domain-containing protein [Caenorhabditis elegans]|uniref:G-protein coupled receptors family 1 profile domain-containing protein n=1 Tax=Caenorhabditis elegans TaxID=6239 RepID=P91378_CAEEL|nr:G-protein coupled receptors family 1 profile domain-containing protein [Caenorhabditis elegans]CCD67257.1 G-protein coupled receptors family 1 profile domain-containing protein [Caenorhabditis elegans]|eukprot:NP_503814.2 Serpentine Receptor, class W [Caenorhabditis elegans]